MGRRGYVEGGGSGRGTEAMVPSKIAFQVVDLLEDAFSEFADYNFTAEIEDDLDRIASGERNGSNWLRDFYYGDAACRGLRAAANDAIPHVVEFGKHRGKCMDAVLEKDPG